MEQGRIGMIQLPRRRTDGSSLSSYRYSHPPPPPTRNSMNQPSSLLGVLNIRSEEHTSELQSPMHISYAVFCLKKKKQNNKKQRIQYTDINSNTTEKKTVKQSKP